MLSVFRPGHDRVDLFEGIRAMLSGAQVAERDTWVAGLGNDGINS